MQKNLRKRTGAKVPLVLLSIFLFLLLFAPAASAATYGDINDDGEINVQDVVLVMKHVLELETLTDTQKIVADVNGDGVINVQDVTLIMQYALGLIDEFPHAALTVLKVTAVNPKQVEVEFNRVLNAEEKAKMTTANFHVGLQAAPLVDRLTGTGSAVAINEDGKTALLTMGNGYYFVSGTTTNRVVVKQAVGIAADHVVANLVFSDTNVPTLVSVHTDSPSTIVMTFSEPLDRGVVPTNISLATSGGVNIPLNLFSDYVYTDARRELRVETFGGVSLAAGTYTLSISSGTTLKDYSGLLVAPTSRSFTHTPITTAPTVSFKSATENSVTIEFSRAIDNTTIVGNTSALFRHTLEGSTFYQVTGTAVSNPSGDRRTFIIDFGTKYLPIGSTTMWLKYADGTVDANKIKDTWGNIIAPFAVSVTMAPDTSAPTAIVSVVSESNTEIDVQYSEAVQNGNIIGNYSLKQGTTTITLTGITDMGGNKYRLSTAPYQMQGAYTLTISNIKDASPSENPMGTQSYAVNVPDTIAPYIVNLAGAQQNRFYWQSAENKVRIFFSEPMNLTDLANKSLFENRVAFSTYEAAIVATPSPDGRSVYLEFTNDVESALDRGIRVGALRDLAGNAMPIATNVTIGIQYYVGLDLSITPAANRVVAESISTVKIYLNEIVAGALPADFEVDKGDGTWRAPQSVTLTTVSGKSVVTLTLPVLHYLEYNAALAKFRTVSAADTATTASTPTVNAKNVDGVGIHVAAVAVTDKIAPALSTAVVTGVDTIVLTFTEGLSPGTFAALGTNGFSVSGSTISTAVLTAPTQVTLTRSGGNNFLVGSSTVSYTQGIVADIAGNKLANFTNVATTP